MFKSLKGSAFPQIKHQPLILEKFDHFLPILPQPTYIHFLVFVFAFLCVLQGDVVCWFCVKSVYCSEEIIFQLSSGLVPTLFTIGNVRAPSISASFIFLSAPYSGWLRLIFIRTSQAASQASLASDVPNAKGSWLSKLPLISESGAGQREL